MSLILTIDVGNTRAKFGMFEAGAAQCPQPLGLSACCLSPDVVLATELQNWINENDFGEITGSLVAGSNPPARDQLVNDWPSDICRPRMVARHTQIPVEMDVQQPETVGIDRLLTALAARTMISKSAPIIVIDSGTATTVNLLTADGTFRGGAILPGLRLSAHAMHDYTARLPLINTDEFSLDDSAKVDAPLPGKNTIDAMKSGLFWGQLGAVKELARRLGKHAVEQFGDVGLPVLVLTGGGGRQMVSLLGNAIYVDCLALHGLAMLHGDRGNSVA